MVWSPGQHTGTTNVVYVLVVLIGVTFESHIYIYISYASFRGKPYPVILTSQPPLAYPATGLIFVKLNGKSRCGTDFYISMRPSPYTQTSTLYEPVSIIGVPLALVGNSQEKS